MYGACDAARDDRQQRVLHNGLAALGVPRDICSLRPPGAVSKGIDKWPLHRVVRHSFAHRTTLPIASVPAESAADADRAEPCLCRQPPNRSPNQGGVTPAALSTFP